MTILFLLLLFSISKACPMYGKVTFISRQNTIHQHKTFKNVSGVVWPKWFFFLIYFIQGLALEAIKDSQEKVAEYIESGCEVNSDEACLFFGINLDENMVESCDYKWSVLRIAVFLNSTNFIRELIEVY